MPESFRRSTHRRRVVAWLRALEGLVAPATTPHDRETPDDYRRIVLFIATIAVGFFLPSLPMAAVPSEMWLPFTALALLAGLILAGSFILLPKSSRLVVPWVVLNGAVTAVLGLTFRDYYHQVPLLFALLVAAHAVVHGLRAALLLVAMGAVLVPYVIQDSSLGNATDVVYAAVYLLGVALIPWVASRLARGRLLEVRRHLAVVVETEREAVQMLARAAEAKDDVTGNHVLRVGELAAQLASATGQDPALVENLRFAAMLHDVGKLHVPDRILMKPGPLDADEWAIIRHHTIWSERILGAAAGFELARRVARSHHENWDGTGYPDGLSREAIPVAARIVHVVDVFDALRSHRTYKAAWPLDRCLEEIEAKAGTMFDPDIARAFIALVDVGGPARTIALADEAITPLILEGSGLAGLRFP